MDEIQSRLAKPCFGFDSYTTGKNLRDRKPRTVVEKTSQVSEICQVFIASQNLVQIIPCTNPLNARQWICLFR